ncbi:MAG TPA: hypothetical protein VIO16_06435 [Dehalococcoidia bacterium]|jgi:hypothetical protein
MTDREPEKLPKLADCLPSHFLPLPESYKDCLVRDIQIDEPGFRHRAWTDLNQCKTITRATSVFAVIVDDAGNLFSVSRLLPKPWGKTPLAFDVRTPQWGTTKSWLGGLLKTLGVRGAR